VNVRVGHLQEAGPNAQPSREFSHQFRERFAGSHAPGSLYVQCEVAVADPEPRLVPPKVMRVQPRPDGSAAARAQAILGRGVTVVSAFHNVAAHRLETNESIDCDVLVFGDAKEARERVVEVAGAARLRGLHGASLANSAAAEALTSVLMFINKHYAADGAGLRITGVPSSSVR